MSWLKDLEPSGIALVLDGIEYLAELAVRKLRGGDSTADTKAADDLAKLELKKKGLEALIAGLEREVEAQAALLLIPDAVDRLQIGQAAVLDAFTPKGMFPSLAGADIEIVDELPKTRPENWDEVTTPPVK